MGVRVGSSVVVVCTEDTLGGGGAWQDVDVHTEGRGVLPSLIQIVRHVA